MLLLPQFHDFRLELMTDHMPEIGRLISKTRVKIGPLTVLLDT